MRSFRYDAFLSHNHRDKGRVRRLAEKLRARGVKVWFDEWTVQAGDDIYLAVERGLEESRTLILCLSPAALGSDWIGLERSTVLFRDPSNAGRRFVPLLLEECELPDTLKRYRYIEYRRHTAARFEELVAAVMPSEAEQEHVEVVEVVAAAPPPAKTRHASTRIAKRVGTMRGHKGGWINRIAVTPDGTLAVSASEDTTLRVWDLATGRCRQVLTGHSEQVNAVVIRPNSFEAFSASDDGSIRQWDVQSGRKLAVFDDEGRLVNAVAVTPNGRYAVAGRFNGGLTRWEVEKSAPETLREEDTSLWDVVTTPDNRFVITSGGEGHVDIFDIVSGAPHGTFVGHSGTVFTVAVSRDGTTVFSGGEDSTVKVWRRDTLQCLGTLEGHTERVFAITLAADGNVLVSASPADHTVRLWDWRSGECLEVLKAGGACSLAVTPDGKFLLVGTKRGTIEVYSLNLPAVPRPTTQSSTRRYVNAKVVLVGDTGVGKSGLAYRLTEDRFVQTESTHGMKVWPLPLPLDPHETFDREALLWDLAGQEDYRLIHQLFLDETALALMVINPQKDDPFADVGQWTKALSAAVASKAAGREVAKLLVAARVDVGGIRISQKKIDRFVAENGFAGYIATSAARGDNCSDALGEGKASALKQLIAKHIPWSDLPWTSTPQLLADIKQAVMEMRDRKEIRLLRFAELSQRLEQTLSRHTFDASDVRTAVRLLANQGLIMPLQFGDLVLMRPELLNGYASAVVRAARAHVDEIGSVREADVYAEDFDFHGVDRLARADEELLLRAMIQTFLNKALCIAEETPAGRQLIFPSQFRRERPIPAHPEVFVSYTFAGEWQTIYTTVVVRLWYSREFHQKELWQNAVEFQTSKGRTAGLVISHGKDGDATISIFFDTGVPDELKWAFIKYVHDHLARYARNVRRDRRYVCPSCTKPVTDLDTVRQRIEAGKDFVYCQLCDEKVPLVDWIEQQLSSDPVARRVLGMVATEKRERDGQALQQILTGHLMAICGEANQIFRESRPERGIAEVEFKDNDGTPSGRKIYVQLRSGGAYTTSKPSRSESEAIVVKVTDPTLMKEWLAQPSDLYLVVRDDETETILWMNVTRAFQGRKPKSEFAFHGERLDAPAIWRVRDQFGFRPLTPLPR